MPMRVRVTAPTPSWLRGKGTGHTIGQPPPQPDYTWQDRYDVGTVGRHPAMPPWRPHWMPAVPVQTPASWTGRPAPGAAAFLTGGLGGAVWGTPLPGPGLVSGSLSQSQARSVASARQELAMGVREQGGKDRGPRVDQYARTSKMRPGGGWCGYFVAFNYVQAGFRTPERLASGYKARRFFLYQDANQLEAHRRQGSTRQFFVLPESNGRSRLAGKNWPQGSLADMTHPYWRLPVQPGDTVMFQPDPDAAYPSHLGMVESYDRTSGQLVTIEGNTPGGKVRRRFYDLTDPAIRRKIAGFGRPAAGDFQA